MAVRVPRNITPVTKDGSKASAAKAPPSTRNAFKPEHELPEADDIEAAPPPSQDKLDRIVELAREQVRLMRRVDKISEELATATKELNTNKFNELPAAMADVGLETFTLGGGASVEVKKIINASVPAPDSKRVENAREKHERGMGYLDEVAPDLVKNTVTIEFPKGAEKHFEKFLRDMQKRKIELTYTVKRAVHAATLSKWVRTQEKLGKSVDEEAISVHRVSEAVVTLPEDK